MPYLGIPYPGTSIQATSDNSRVVWAPRNSTDSVLMIPKSVKQFERRNGMDHYDPVAATACEPRTIVRERDPPDFLAMTFQLDECCHRKVASITHMVLV
jgi:hypothetical protein